MPGWGTAIGEFLGGLRDGFRWWSNPHGKEQWQKERQGRKLQEAADEAFKAWITEPTATNWSIYAEARDALKRHSTTP